MPRCLGSLGWALVLALLALPETPAAQHQPFHVSAHQIAIEASSPPVPDDVPDSRNASVAAHATDWSHADLSGLTGAPAAVGSALVAYSWGDYRQAVYLTADGHVHELFASTSASWNHADLSALTGAPAAVGNALVGYTWGAYKQIAYLTADGHVHELFVSTSAGWNHADLSALTGAPAAVGNALVGYSWGDYKQVVYLTADGHVHELFASTGAGWSHADLSALTGAPAAVGNALVGYSWRNHKQVVYLTADGHLHELGVRDVSTPVRAQSRAVTGEVRDRAGARLSGVTITLLRNGEVVRTVTTDEAGRFYLPVNFEPAGRYEARIALPGAATHTVEITPDMQQTHIGTEAFQADVSIRGLQAAPAPPGPPPSDPKHAIVPVYYATDRDRLSTQPVSYGSQRNPAESLHLGRFDVSIPRDVHEMAAIERPTIWTLYREDPDRHFVIVQRTEEGYEDFYHDLSGTIAKSTRKQVLVFLHGYNVAFDDAVYRTAQLSYDLNFDGASVLYSWPSVATLLGYPIDANNAEWTVPHLRAFLEDVATKTQAQVIHVIAHSMGNRPLVKAMNLIAAESAPEVRARFSQVVLTAPDIDAGVFRQLAAVLRRAAQHVTLYASSNDLALRASEQFQGYQRAGDSAPDVLVVEGIDTIDVSAVDTSFIGHSYFGDKRSVLTDLFYLLRDGLPPDQRAGLDVIGQSPNRHWRFRQ